MKDDQQSFPFEPIRKPRRSNRNDGSQGCSPPRKDIVTTTYGSADRRFMRRREVEAITGWSRSTLYRQIAAKAFPAPVRLSSNTVGFLASEVFAWIENRLALRQDASNATEIR